MTIIIVWFVGAILVGVIAGNKGRSGFGWFLLALIISPLLAVLFALAVKDLRPQPVSAAFQSMAPPRSIRRASLGGDGKFRLPIVGESHYQDALHEIVGAYDEDEGVRNHPATVYLTPETDNPYDPNAVVVKIRGKTVGYLARDTAPLFLQALVAGGFGQAACDAVINGGWDRGDDDRGDLGVRLNATMPFRLEPLTMEPIATERYSNEAPRGGMSQEWFWIGVGAILLVAMGVYLTNRSGSPTVAVQPVDVVGEPEAIAVPAIQKPILKVVPVPKPRPKPKPKSDPNAPMDLTLPAQ